MAMVPLSVLAALGAIGANAAVNYKASKRPNRITNVPFEEPQAIVTKPGPSTTKGGTSRRVRRSRQPATRAIKAPIAGSGVTRNRVPRSLLGPEGLVITHCEPFAATTLNALGTLSYQTQAFIPSILPYLTGIASNFAKYKWLKLHLYYVPSCPTSTLGEQAMGTFYDNQDASAATFLQTAQMKGGISYPPWGGGPEYGADAVTVDIDVNQFDKPRYNYITVANFNALTTSDRNNYCPALLAIASQGSTAAVATSGRIWLSYSIHLIDPIPAGLNA